MVCQPLRLALLIGAITAVAVSPVRANFRAPRCSDPCGSPCAGTTAPAYRTVTCTEWVRENVTSTRTAYKVECRTESYDTWRTECVPVVKENVVTVMKRVPVVREETRKVCHKVTVYENRVVNKTSHKYVQETVMKKQLVRLGHWDCKEVPALFNGFGGGLGGGLFSGHGHGQRGCNDSCGTACKSDACSTPCRTRTKKVWVHCPEYRECPTTVCKKVCVTEAVTCKVAVCKNEWREEKVKVCSFECVAEKQTVKCTVYESRKVACKATRTVRVCVPYQETVTCCKLVPRTVTRQVAVANSCGSSSSCGHSSNDCCERAGLLSGLRDRLRRNGDCCRPASTCCK